MTEKPRLLYSDTKMIELLHQQSVTLAMYSIAYIFKKAIDLKDAKCRMAPVDWLKATTQDWEGFSLRSVCTATQSADIERFIFNLARFDRRDKERKRKDYP